MRYALAYLVCFQITVNHVYIAHCQQLIDCGINLYIQKEQLTLLDEEGHPSLFAPIMIATLSTCAQLERDNISFLAIIHNNNNIVSPLYKKNNSNEKDINGHCGYFSHD